MYHISGDGCGKLALSICGICDRAKDVTDFQWSSLRVSNHNIVNMTTVDHLVLLVS